MLNKSELESLLATMRASRVTTLVVKNKEQRLRLVVPPSSLPSTLTPTPTSAQPIQAVPSVERMSATSPTIGTFLRRGSDDGLALLTAGMRVTTGEILGYVCHGPVRVIVDAPDSGVLTDKGPLDGAVMGVGDTVFNLDVTP